MLEIPEGATVASQLNTAIKGAIISEVIAAQSPHSFTWYHGDPKGYEELLGGKRIDKVMAHGGHVEIYAENTRINLWDGVNPRYLKKGDKIPAKHQLYIKFDDETGLVCTVQMYGGLQAFENGAFDDNFYYTAAKEKPNPLSDEFSTEYFTAILAGAPSKLSAKALLATEQRIPGLGNGCVQDILFNARINHQSKISLLKDHELENLFKSIKTTLKSMTDAGGRDTEKDLFGNSGGYKTLLSAKTSKMPCPACGGFITRKAYLGGNVYYCENCQPIIK